MQKLKKLKKNDVITVIGNRWFDKINGNTYHSTVVYVNGDLIGNEPFTYGYDDQYIQTGREILEKQYKIPLESYQSLWRLSDYGIKLITNVSDVSRKKDL